MKLTVYFPLFFVICMVVIASCNRDKNTVTGSNKRANLNSAINKIDDGTAFYNKGVYDSAFISYNQSKLLLEKNGDSARIVYPLLRMAQIQQNAGDYFGCEATATEALQFITKNDTSSNTVEVYNLLGRSYRKLYNYKSAISYYKKAIAAAKDSLPKCIVYNNISMVYANQKKYDKAVAILEKLNSSDIVNKHLETKARVISNLGHLYFLLKKPEAQDYLIRGCTMRKEINDRNGLIASYLELSEFYAGTNKSQSKEYASKAYSLATDVKSQDDRLLALRNIVTMSQGKEQPQRTEQYFKLSDSLEKVRLSAKHEFAKIKYDAKVIEDRLKEQKVKNRIEAEESSNRITVLALLSVFALSGLVAFFYVKRIKYRREKLLQVYATETRISKKIHDELANDVFKVMSFAEAESFSSVENQQKLLKNLDSIYTKTRNISRENNSIDTGENFAAELREMLADYKTAAINVMVVNYNSIAWSSLTEPKKITVYRVLQELMVNMKKHSQASVVVLKFNVLGKKIIIQYSDNGTGLPDNKIILKNGLQNAETRMKSVNGYITFENESGKGLKATLEITL
jgi:signal transduction histidine kinase